MKCELCGKEMPFTTDGTYLIPMLISPFAVMIFGLTGHPVASVVAGIAGAGLTLSMVFFGRETICEVCQDAQEIIDSEKHDADVQERINSIKQRGKTNEHA